jgi:hypothetical protein
MTGHTPADDEAHLAALLAVLAHASGDGRPDDTHLTPLQQWRARRLAALRSSTSTEDVPSRRR